MAARRPNSHTPSSSIRLSLKSNSIHSSWEAASQPANSSTDWGKENTLNSAALLARVRELEACLLSSHPEVTLLQATIKALRADNEALKEENRIVTEVMKDWEKTEQAQWLELRTRLEDSIRMLEDQLATVTGEKRRLEGRLMEMERRVKGRDKGREVELEAEVMRLRKVVEEKDLENDRMVHRLHAFMQEAEEARTQLRTLKRTPSRTSSRSISRKSSFVDRKSSRCSPIPFSHRPASVSRLR